MNMKAFVKRCDSISDWVGRTFAWMAVPIAILVVYEVISRRVFNNPHLWALDTATLLYAIHFMMVGAYGLLYNSHVNIDTIYMYLPRRWQADGLDSVSYLLLFFPYFFIFLYAGTDLAIESVQMGDRTVTGVPIIVPVMKTLMPLLWVFQNEADLKNFISSGFELGADVNLQVNPGANGGIYQGAAQIQPGVWLYQLSDAGLALDLTVEGTKYFKDPDLN